MDLWTFHRYRQPRLCVDEITLDESDRQVLVLRQGPQIYRFAFDDADAAVQVAEDMATLRDGDAPLWQTIRASPPGQGWGAICEFLDSHSLIREDHDRAAESVAGRTRRIKDCVVATATAALERLSPDRLSLVTAHASLLRRELNSTSAWPALDATVDPFDAAMQPNFFLGLLTVEFAYFRRASPPTLAAADALLGLMSGDEPRPAPWLDEAMAEDGALYDQRDLEAHLWLVAQCLVAASAPDAPRLPTPDIPKLALSSGLEFMRQVEILTRTTLSGWGQNRYVAALDALNGGYSPLVAGPFIEQYHITRRFVEIIAPLLSQRLVAPLRQMMFRYYSEEVGHEALESTTCEAMGVSQTALDQALPLPLHFAFVDALTLVAMLDPIASFAAIMVIEGVFGEPPKMSLRLAAVARANPSFQAISGDHDELNETLNHNSISRDAFEHIAAVPPSAQARVMRRILFLLELNHRAWGGIADFYGGQNELWLQGPLGRPLSRDGVPAG